jgi:DNA-3-methyladenine glycosylase II
VAVSRAAVRHLKRADPKLRRIIERVGPYRPRSRDEGEHFDHLIRAIVYQQLAGAAAATIHGRLLALYGDKAPTPAQLLATRPAALRRAGLSPQKLGYVIDLARKVASGSVALDQLPGHADEAVIEALTQVKGVGTWTAQMFLMFRLGRPDVLPVQDLGIQKAMRRAYGLRAMPSPKRMEKIAASWRPYRTVACWYLWRSLDLPAGGR